MKFEFLFPALLLLIPISSHGQHEHHMPQQDTMQEMIKEDSSHANHSMNMMSHAYSLHLPMNRNGSGTGWLPDASPMYAHMIHSKHWMYMIHYNVFIRYNDQDFTDEGARGASKFDIPNWLMFMGQRQIGQRGLLHFNTMFSLDAVITGGSGYPLLFQTGETHHGAPLVDRQHPHDLFSELSIGYSYSIKPSVDAFIYLAYPGEPALGPVAFMHRPSALNNPDAPLSHHWVDATHITFGVATLGVRAGKFKLEGSSFTGREPDEDRYGFDKPRFDSWSSRLSFNPDKHWALQASHAFLKSPELLHPDIDINRTTASIIYSQPMLKQQGVDATITWGLNKVANQNGENAFLIEGVWYNRLLSLYTRYEYVQKSGEELALDMNGFEPNDIFSVQALTVGFNYQLPFIKPVNFALGSQLSYNITDPDLYDLYGKHPLGIELFLRFHPLSL